MSERPMIELLARMLGTAPSGPTDALVRQVVEASVPKICARVAPRIDTMTLSEARGYVRARAADVVRHQTQIALRSQPKSQQSDAVLIARTVTERLVPIVLRQTGVGVPRAGRLTAAA